MKKKHKKKLKIYSTRIIIFISIPIILYLLNFGGNGFSIKSTNWSEFGSFIGGYGTFIFSAANLYFLIKVAYSINHLDDKRNDKNKIDSVKPLGISTRKIDYNIYSYKFVISNLGLGPLIVKDYNLNHNGIKYENFQLFLKKNAPYIVLDHFPIRNNTFFVGINKEHCFFEITLPKVDKKEIELEKDDNKKTLLENLELNNLKKFEQLVCLLKSVELTFECEDILKNSTELLVK